MKRSFIAAGLLLLVFWGGGGKGYATQDKGGLCLGFGIMKKMGEEGVTVWKAWEDKERLEETKKEEYIASLLSGMDMEEKLSQMLFFTDARDMAGQDILRCQPGGILFFSTDFDGKTAEQIKERTKRLQENAKYPMFVAVDEEGGTVSRTKGMRGENLPCFSGARDLWEEENTELVKQDTRKKAEFLGAMGLNLNFAPVADVTDKKGAYMYTRSAGGDGESVAGYVRAVVSAMQEENMGSCIKHFPGYGNNANTHVVYTEDSRPLSDYRSCDFLPFQAGIEQGTDMVMVSHIVMRAVDAKNPASLSRKVHDLLRQELGFDGVIIADDLNMGAVRSQMSLEEASAKAVLAGNDMIFSADYAASMKGLLQAEKEGLLSEEQIDESVTRILKMKMERKMIAAP